VLVVAQCKALLWFAHSLTDEQRRELRSWRPIGGRVSTEEGVMCKAIEIRTVPIGVIDPNPHRDLKTYPWIESKVGQLRRSIAEVGFWAGVIARPHGNRYQMAFGHRRLEAARRNELKEVPLIVQPLTDLQMLQFMGRENGEDYSAEFLVMLNRGGLKVCRRSATKVETH
jgi:ParB/Sulfiredoxin domain